MTHEKKIAFGSMILICCCICHGHDEVHGITYLKYYEVLSSSQLHIQTQRADGTGGKAEILIDFNALNRSFHLSLTPNTDVLAADFKASILKNDGSSSTFHVDHSNIFTGFVNGIQTDEVIAFKEDSLWSIKFFHDGYIFGVEPAWRFGLDNSPISNMIVYSSSDLEFNKITAAYMTPNKDERNDLSSDSKIWNKEETEGNKDIRHEVHKKRRSLDLDTCLVLAVGDTSFFKNWCRSSKMICMSALISSIKFVDSLYKQQTFLGYNDKKITGIRIQIGAIYLCESEQACPDSFNLKGSGRGAEALLKDYGKSNIIPHADYCLTHLFTAQGFEQGVMGLAWLGTPNWYGICAGDKLHGGDGSTNIGLTTFVSKVMTNVPSVLINLVTAHEIGHNFGSHHDPEELECAPSDAEGGKYLMWAYSVKGQHENNFWFSACSKRSIGPVIDIVKDKCFVAHSQAKAICGNGLIEDTEECDAGIGDPSGQECCSPTCTLRWGKTCSERNHHCCKNCNMAPNNTICWYESVVTCQQTAYCNGISLECPLPEPMPDGTRCLHHGKCYGGVCLPFCQVLAMEKKKRFTSCSCDTEETACKHCCIDNSDSSKKCLPMSDHFIDDGEFCYKGICQSGECLLVRKPSLMGRWISTATGRSGLEKFLRSNIVLVVAVLSLIIWIPYVRWVNKKDRENRELIKRFSERYSYLCASYAQRGSAGRRSAGHRLDWNLDDSDNVMDSGASDAALPKRNPRVVIISAATSANTTPGTQSPLGLGKN